MGRCSLGAPRVPRILSKCQRDFNPAPLALIQRGCGGDNRERCGENIGTCRAPPECLATYGKVDGRFSDQTPWRHAPWFVLDENDTFDVIYTP
eukprot:scaffold1928_cov381-Prasinococcus_capsulatus_cf.AAC.22